MRVGEKGGGVIPCLNDFGFYAMCISMWELWVPCYITRVVCLFVC